MLGIPAETLIDDDGMLLSDRYAVSYVPSATIYAWLTEKAAEKVPAGEALLVGDPPLTESDLAEMDEPEETREPLLAATERLQGAAVLREALAGNDQALATLPRLPGTREEVERLAAIHSEGTVLLEAEASEQNLVRLAESGKLADFMTVHLATHALVDDERPERSALVLSQIDLPDPLEAAGEGYIGFAHAFLQAGTRSLLVSLWKVEDRATSLLMRRFYENRSGAYQGVRSGRSSVPMPKAQALQEAKRWLRNYTDSQGHRPFEHPYYWSAFTLIGERG